MRGSPISNLRNRQDYSPYESNPRNSSPRTNANSPSRHPHPSSEVDYWRGKARQVESELLAVNEELMLQLRKIEKMDDIQEKLEMLLAQNQHFLEENQNLIRLVQQKNSEIDLWKKRFDAESTNSNIAEAEKRKVFDHLNLKDQEHQIQIDKLLAEITRLQAEAVQADNLRKLEIHRLKNQYESQSMAQIQNLRRSHNGNNQIQQLNIRKLKEVIDEKDFEIQNLNRQIRLKNEQLKNQSIYSKNQLKKLQQQKIHEIDLIKTENENVKNNLARQHRKNQQELKNLHEAKVKRLTYEIQQKKNEIEQGNNRLKRTGKDSQGEVTRLINDNAQLRNQLKDNDNLNRQRIKELTQFYDNQFSQERQTNNQRQTNLIQYYDNNINLLKHIIDAKDEEIKRLLELNSSAKANEEHRLQLIKENNYELKHKIEDIIKHYEREIELTKIKIGQLYQVDLDSLKDQLRNSYANHQLETETIRNTLKQTRHKLANEVQDKLDLRKDYELRLSEFAVSHDRTQKDLKSIVAQREKQIQGHTSKASLTHIQHNQLLQTRNINMKQLMTEKRNLETIINGKNKEIETLNLKVQQMLGFHKRQVDKLEEELSAIKNQHDAWIKRQQQETKDWHDERSELNKKIESLNKMVDDIKKKNQEREAKLGETVSQKGLEVSGLKGRIEELQNKIKALGSKNQVQVQNVEKTILETRTLMNSEKDKLTDTFSKDKRLVKEQAQRVREQLQSQLSDLRKENDILLDNYNKALIREEELKLYSRGLADSVNKRSKLEESVINIGLSNNYFKNVAEIFKRIDS